LAADEVRSILLGTAMDLGDTGRDDEFGYGLVDAEAAVIAAQNHEIPTLPDDPDGTDDPGGPMLSLSTEDVDLGLVSKTDVVSVSNGGTGTLNIINVTPLTDDDSDWLSVATSGSDDTTNVTTIEITVDREGLEPNFYSGVLLIEAVGLTPVLVAVEMEIPEITFQGTIIVEVIDMDTNEVVATTETTDLDDFDYVFNALPPGRYTLTAGTDFDGDGEICEDDDLCGMFEDTVTVVENKMTSDLDFLVSPPAP
jgi:serine protease